MTNLQNLLSKYSNGGASKYDYDKEKQRPYVKLKELNKDEKYTIEAIFINTKSKFGPQGAILTEEHVVNLPTHLTDMIVDMRDDDEMTEAINQRLVAFEIYTFTSKKYNRESYSINIVPSDIADETRAFGGKEE